MDGSGPPAQPRPPLQVQNLIRPEQVAKLPQLTAQQKQATEKRVSQFWEIIHANSNNPNNPKYLQASQGLAQLSNNLMQSMKAYNVQKRQQQQQAQTGQQSIQAPQNREANPAQNPTNGQTQNPPSNAGQGFASLLPEIQAKVRSLNFEYPPAMAKGTPPAEVWIAEAQLRYGQAIQRAQMAANKKRDLQRAAQLRTQQGSPLTQEDQNGLNGKLAACDKAIKESQNFMEKFRAQQESFKKEKAEAAQQHQREQQQQQQQQRLMLSGMPGGGPSDNTHSDSASNPSQMQAGIQGPQAHSIATAQAAARATSSSNTVPQPQPVSSTVTGSQQTPIDQAQAAFNASNTMNQAPSRPSTAAGPQSAVNPNANVQASHAHPNTAVNPHPISNAINGMKGHPAIPKVLQVTDPKPVPMPPSRPTLNGGANVGLPGQIAQPALTTFPGYVLEQSADGHLVSKKKLAELVREVMGPNSEEMLTPEAEEITLTLVDDFIDDVLSSACKLTKLRNGTSLEARDVQVVLERQYNIRVPGFSTDEVRTVKKIAPAAGWAHKVGAVGAAKLMNGTGGAAAVGGPATGNAGGGA